MKFQDIVLSLVIIIVFIFLYSSSAITVKLDEIKQDWPLYRCLPMAMPFASYFGSDPVENFSYCVGNIQKDMMGYFLNPIQYILGMITNQGGFLLERIQFIRKFMDYLRNMTSNLIGDTYGMLVNVIIQFQKLIIKVKDLVMKLMGVMMTMMYLVQGSVLTGRSVYNGPIGKVLRELCFSPDTPIKLQDGNIVKIKDIKLGDILENGSEVLGCLKLKGSKKNPYYKIWSKELLDYIYVTGSHKVCAVDKNGKISNPKFLRNYINVDAYWKAKKTEIYSEELSCLITSNHQIKIGEHIFWDWED